MSLPAWVTLSLDLAAVALLAAIVLVQQRHHHEIMSALGKINHSIASVNAAVHLLRTEVERRG